MHGKPSLAPSRAGGSRTVNSTAPHPAGCGASSLSGSGGSHAPSEYCRWRTGNSVCCCCAGGKAWVLCAGASAVVPALLVVVAASLVPLAAWLVLCLVRGSILLSFAPPPCAGGRAAICAGARSGSAEWLFSGSLALWRCCALGAVAWCSPLLLSRVNLRWSYLPGLLQASCVPVDPPH